MVPPPAPPRRRGDTAGSVRHFFGLTAVTAVVVGFLRPDFGLNLNSAVIALGFMVALLVMSLGFSLPADVGVHRRTGEWGNFLPGTLLVSIVRVALSRVFHFRPGYMYGALAGLPSPAPSREPTRGSSPPPTGYGR